MTIQSFAVRFRAARLAAGFTQAAAGRLLGKQQHTVSEWEADQHLPDKLAWPEIFRRLKAAKKP